MADKFKPCSVAGCNDNSHYIAGGVKGYCRAHYRRLYRYGDPLAGHERHYRQLGACQVPGCGKPKKSLGYCNAHYLMMKLRGDPLAGGTSPGAPMEWLQRNVAYTGDECLVWPFYINQAGYGMLQYGGRSSLASRVMCVLAHGDPPSSEHQAAHKCGNGHLGCINPRHLRWATPKENCSDKVAHGTQIRGERHYISKLTEDDVRQIRALRPQCPRNAVAQMFGVSPQTISDITSGKTWSHVS